MDEETVVNTISSVYNHKPKILPSFRRKNRKINTYFKPKISNYLEELQYLKNLSPKTKKQITNEDDKKIFNYRYTFNNERISHSLQKLNNIKDLIENKTKTINSHEKRRDLIKRDKKVYLLRKLYIILPNDKMIKKDNYKISKLQINFYFPTEIKSKRIIDFIEEGKKDDIICDNLRDIFLEVYKYLKLSINDFVKLEIYDGKFHPIKMESQLLINKIRIINLKITYISEEEIKAWKERLKSRFFFSNFIYFNKSIPEKIKLNYIYNDVSTEINQEESKNKKLNLKNNSKPVKIIKQNSNYISTDFNNSTRYNTINQIQGRKKLFGNLKLDLQESNKPKPTLSIERKSLNSTYEKDNKFFISDNSNRYTKYLKTFDKTSNQLTDSNEHEKFNINNKEKELSKFRIKKYFFYDIIKKREEKNTLLSPILFNFDVTDIINNKYVLKYLINKNKDKNENNIFKIKNKFEVKTLNIEDSNSKREKKANTIPNIKTNLIDKNNFFHNMQNSKIEKNKKLLCELNIKLNEFVDDNIDNLILDDEIEDFNNLNSNYILINELKNFPLLKLKKKFIFFVYLSQKASSKYENIFNNLIFEQNIIENILKLDECENYLYYLYNIYSTIIQKKNFLVGYLRASNIDLKIPFAFFLLFIFFNKNLIEKNPKIKLINISLECVEINVNDEIIFQQYIDYILLFTRNNFLSCNKKYNFIKDLILRIFIYEKFNTKRSLKILKMISDDINTNKIMKILNSDMCSVKLEKNIDINKEVEKIYNRYLNYMEH